MTQNRIRKEGKKGKLSCLSSFNRFSFVSNILHSTLSSRVQDIDPKAY